MEKQVTAQELYNQFYFEACERARVNGQPLPNEVEVFKILVKESRKAILNDECPPDFIYQLEEVKPHIALEQEAARRAEARDLGLREGTLTDINDIYNLLGIKNDESTDKSNG